MFLAYLWEFTVHEYSICMSHLDSGLYFWVPCPTCVPGDHWGSLGVIGGHWGVIGGGGGHWGSLGGHWGSLGVIGGSLVFLDTPLINEFIQYVHIYARAYQRIRSYRVRSFTYV